jgi:hypothetical protein
MPGIKTDHLEGITSYISYPNGQIETCRLSLRNIINTPYGDMIPKYSQPGIRDKELKSLSFYESGMVRAIYLETQTDVLTPMGIFPAELVTFYEEDGALESIFPLNGQIGFGWSEKEEKTLAQSVLFDFPFGSFETKPIGLRFYPGGELKSMILWPDEIIYVQTSLGTIPVRIGFKLFKNGNIESIETAYPTSVPTPIGKIVVFDNTAIGIDADNNSLRFDESGKLRHLVTSGDIIVKKNTDGRRYRFSSRTRTGLTDDVPVKLPVHITFRDDIASIDDGAQNDDFRISDCEILILSDFGLIESCDGVCDGCALCP